MTHTMTSEEYKELKQLIDLLVGAYDWRGGLSTDEEKRVLELGLNINKWLR